MVPFSFPKLVNLCDLKGLDQVENRKYVLYGKKKKKTLIFVTLYSKVPLINVYKIIFVA